MLLRTENLTKDYGSFRAVDHLNLEIAPGEIFGLLGPNGSGKSTAIRMLLGFLRPTSGAAWVNGFHCWRDSVNARQQISYLPGELRLYENMTGAQLLQFLTRLRGGTDREELRQMARTLDIDLSRPILQLSSGMKRKVALLVVLAPHAPLLILDEPTNTLDPTMRDELMNQLRRARERGQTILFSSHVLTEVEQVCDRVGILQRGKLVHLQAMKELRQTRRVRVHFTQPMSAVPEFAGIVKVEQTADALDLEFDGPLQPVLDWVAGQSIRDMTVEPVGLSATYKLYHGTEA
jgi:ABC-2 type transport system ATP-binding protein